MKTNQKKLKLIQYGLKPSTVTRLDESQVNILFNRLTESKKETKEQASAPTGTTQNVTKTVMKLNPNTEVSVNGSVVSNKGGVTTITKEGEMVEDMDSEMDWLMKGDTQDPEQEPSSDGTDDERGDSELDEYKTLAEKFESKKQQRYFFAKCGDGKTKEQKKWCKMADEFAEKTNFKKLPEKVKDETNEEGMSNLNKKIEAAYAGGLKKQLNNVSFNPTFGESEIEKNIMRLVEKHITPKMSKKDFLNLVKEQGTKTAPSRPDVKPDVDTPTRPSKPATPYQPKPGVKPAPKAKKQIPTWLKFSSIGIKLKGN